MDTYSGEFVGSSIPGGEGVRGVEIPGLGFAHALWRGDIGGC